MKLRGDAKEFEILNEFSNQDQNHTRIDNNSDCSPQDNNSLVNFTNNNIDYFGRASKSLSPFIDNRNRYFGSIPEIKSSVFSGGFDYCK